MTDLAAEIRRRRTFAIISHPDAGKTTLTEKLLLFGGAIQMAGTVKGRKAARHATSDWMRLEQQRGISVTSSVMQFPYRDCIVNLLDTPGHEDFSEDTYRTLTAVDSALMVIDCAKGVEERTIKLMEVCRLRDTPIMTFINKLDRDGRAADRAARRDRERAEASAPRRSPGRSAWGASCAASITCARIASTCYSAGERGRVGENRTIEGLHSAAAREFLGDAGARLRRGDRAGAGAPRERFDVAGLSRRAARRRCSSARPSTTSASRSCWRPSRATRRGRCRARRASARWSREEPALAGFVFKIQANMDPAHRDRIAFLRLCAGRYSARHAPVSRAPRQGGARRRCTHLHGRRPRAGRGSLRRRHHRPAQPRHDQHRRHLHAGRAAHLHRRARTSPRRSSAARC